MQACKDIAFFCLFFCCCVFWQRSQPHRDWLPPPHQPCNYSIPYTLLIAQPRQRGFECTAAAMPQPRPHKDWGCVSPMFLSLIVGEGAQQLQCKPESQPNRNLSQCPHPYPAVVFVCVFPGSRPFRGHVPLTLPNALSTGLAVD